jgi:beta-lactamase class C
MRFLRPALLCLLAVIALPAAVAQAIDYDRLDQRLTRLAAEEDMVGLAVAVIEDGEIRFAKGYGYTAIGGAAVTDETVFRWASLSKGVAASQIAILAGQARLNLSDTVAKFKTSLRLPGGGETQATLEDVCPTGWALSPTPMTRRWRMAATRSKSAKACSGSNRSARSANVIPTRTSPSTRLPKSSNR